ncbi:MAG: GTPase domain-containing protein [Spirochaetaceae bacterium]|nr:GTPase domain-containing protein [Spirochaetaceae bacterium]
MEPTLAALDRFEDSKDILNAIKRAFHHAAHEIGTVNVLIAGRTGVGKSTLINEIFQGRLAETGQGMPITKETRRLTKKGIPLAIYDTRGLELKEYQQIIEELVEFAGAQARDTDGYQHIHVAWLSVAEDGRRVEAAEVELYRRLAELMPVLGVITKARADQGFRAEVQRLLPRPGTWCACAR